MQHAPPPQTHRPPLRHPHEGAHSVWGVRFPTSPPIVSPNEAGGGAPFPLHLHSPYRRRSEVWGGLQAGDGAHE